MITIINKKYFFIFVISLCFTHSTFDAIIDDLLKGKTDKTNLNEITKLINDNPNDIDAVFVQALIEEDGEKAIELFSKYYEIDKEEKYDELLIKKIADYNYSKGLYIKAASWYKIIPEKYPKSEYLESSINYYLNSLLVSGNYEEVEQLIIDYKKKYPKINFNDNKENKNKDNKNKQSNVTYSVLVGSYEQYKIALDYKRMLSKEGFLCRIEDVQINGQNYYALKIGYYKNKKTAENILKRLKSRVGITNAIILEN